MKPLAGNDERVLIIGGGIAGRNVCRELLRLGKSAGITLVKRESHGSYSPCGLPAVIGGELGAMEDILFPGLDRKLAAGNVRVLPGTEIREIDLGARRAETDGGESLAYDRLVIATGRRPHIPPIPGADKGGVCTLSDFEDGMRIQRELPGTRRAVVIGGGFIGCELATALLQRGVDTTLVEIAPHILPQILDGEMAALLQERLGELGCRIITGRGVARINVCDRAESVSVDGLGAPLPAELVLIATGVIPETTLAASAGCEIGRLSGLVTDGRQHPRAGGKFLEEVYALGDCVEITDMLTGSARLSPLTETAIVQARIVARDMAGNRRPGAGQGEGHVCSSLTLIGGRQVGMTGLTGAEARAAGMRPRAVQTTGRSKEVYYPGQTTVHLRLLADADRIIGAQLIGEEEVRGMLNEISALIRARTGVDDILRRQRGYTPALASSPDVFTRALEKLSD
ncbi:MAG: FAD/NAD(P)-binding oxidoreductase [bacterium]|nr:FAD/NAD(P)-binding oxidoreductase [bacterium]